MTGKTKKLFHSRGTIRQFLFSKTDTGRLRDIRTRESAGIEKMLTSAFPDTPSGSGFIEHAMARLNSSARFGAMAIRLDQSPCEDERHPLSRVVDEQIEVARILDALCRKENGLWGPVDPGLLGGFFPEKNGTKSLGLARSLQKRLGEHSRQTVTIGVAVYPSITYQKSEIMENARKALDHATFFGPNSAVIFDSVSLNISGDRLYEKGDIQGAVAEFDKALVLDPSNVNVYNSLGVCYGLLGNYAQAAEKFETAVSMDPQEYMALYNLGLIGKLTGHGEQALDFFLRADQLNGKVYEVALQIGKLYLESGDAEKAKAFLQRAAEIKPDAVGVYRYLGDCHAGSGMSAEAISAYKKALKHNPADAASMSALGCLFDETGESPEIALMFCRESIGLAPENGLYHYRLGRLYHNQNRFEEALLAFDQANRLGYDAAADIHAIQHQLEEKCKTSS